MRTAVFFIYVSIYALFLSSCGDTNHNGDIRDSTQVEQVDTMRNHTPAKEKPVDTLVREKEPAEKPISHLIQVDKPLPSARIASPLSIKGEAVGYWYFEADFPVRLYDANDSLLATAIAMANGEWMTENFVPFSATMKFNKPATATGKLVFEKSNPSGLKENDRSYTIQVRF